MARWKGRAFGCVVATVTSFVGRGSSVVRGSAARRLQT